MKQLIVALALVTLAIAQDCPLPTKAEIEAVLPPLLVIADGGQSYSPNVTEGLVQYVCLAQGSMINTYEAIALIATFTPNPGEAEQTMIFDIECISGTWSGRTGSLDPPPPSVVDVPPRTDCYRCREGFGGDTRCRACDSACNSGLMRCNGSGSGDCCLSFTASGQCDGSTDCTSSGPSYVATESNNFTCTCNLTCSAGYTANSNCTDCDLSSICDAYSPCMNGGQCIQYSPATNYSCDCTGSYTGYNCSDCGLTCSDGYTVNSDCTNCNFTSICDRDTPCINGGQCMQYSPATNYTCDCTGSYTGYNCSDCSLTCSDGYTVNSDCTDCDFTSICDRDTPCINGGQCMQYFPATNYSCHCAGSYTGTNCSICSPQCLQGYVPNSDCTGCVLSNICIANNPCKNGGSCTSSINGGYTCNCTGNYKGDNCSVCSLSCQNSGNATSDCTGCMCPALYTGNSCQTVIDPCMSLEPCGLYGTCSSNRTEYMCQCHEGWSGPHCQDCTIENCDRCSGIPPICESCMEGYVIDETGKGCELKDLCHTTPCANNGTCIGQPGSFTCQCSNHWSSASNCTICSDGYGLRNDLCVECSKNCLVCAESFAECVRCEDEYEVSSSGECISSDLPNNILIWIIIGSVIGGLVIFVCVVIIVMGIVRCTTSYNHNKTHARATKKDHLANQKINENPLYMSQDDIDNMEKE